MSDTLAAARRALEDGALHDAQRLLEDSLRQDPGSAESTHLLGRLRFATGDHAGAAELLRTAFEQRPDSAEFAHDLGFALQRLGAFDEAEQAYQRAIDLAGDEGAGVQAIAALAELNRLVGDSESAWSIASQAFDRGVRDARLIITYARLRARRGDLQGAGAILAQIVGQIQDRPVRSEAAFALGEICDRLTRYDDAFRAFAHGNELMTGAFDLDSYRRGVDTLIQAWTPEVARALPRGADSEQPVFVLGMP